MEENVKIFRIDFEGQDKILEEMARMRKASEDLKDENKELNKLSKEGNLEAAKAFEENRVQISKNAKEVRQLSKQYEASAKATKDTTGSLIEMRGRLRDVTTAYDNLTKEQRENAQVGGVMQKSIADLSKELTELERATGRNQRNVGNYQDAIDTTNMSIKEMQLQLRALREIPLDNLKPEEIMKVEQAMGKLTDSIDKANARIKVQAMDDIPALVASLQGVVAASQLVVGSMALFGVEDERLKKLTQTMIQLVGVSQALATIQQLVASGQAAALAVKVKTVAVNTAQVVGTKLLAAAQWIYNGALFATKRALDALGIGLILTVITALVAAVTLLWKNWDKVAESLQKVARWVGLGRKETEQLIDTTHELIKANDQLIKQSESKSRALDLEIRMLKALGASQDLIAEKQRELLQNRLEESRLAAENAAILVRQGQITVDAYGAAQRAFASAREELFLFEAGQIRFERERAERAEQERQREIERINDIAARRREAARKQAEDELKQLQERAKRDEKARLELAIIESRSEEDRINARIALLKWETEQLLSNDQLTQNERLLIQAESIERQLDLENILLERQLQQQNQFDELEKQRQLDLEQFEIDLLSRKREREQAQLEFEHNITDARIDSAMALTDALMFAGKEQSLIFRAAKAIQKSVALAEIGISLQRELAAINVAAAIQDAVLPGAGRVYALTQRIRAISQSLAAGARIMAFNAGGVVPGKGSRDTVPAMLTPGEGVLRQQAMNASENWTLSGTPKQIASRLNQAYGGVEFRNRGGIIGSTASISTRNASRELGSQQLIEQLSRLPIVVTVEDINAKLGSESIRVDLASYV